MKRINALAKRKKLSFVLRNQRPLSNEEKAADDDDDDDDEIDNVLPIYICLATRGCLDGSSPAVRNQE